jgi:hypothetical protein
MILESDTAFGSNDGLSSASLEGPAQPYFRFSKSIHIGRVKEIDPFMQGNADSAFHIVW